MIRRWRAAHRARQQARQQRLRYQAIIADMITTPNQQWALNRSASLQLYTSQLDDLAPIRFCAMLFYITERHSVSLTDFRDMLIYLFGFNKSTALALTARAYLVNRLILRPGLRQ